MRPFAQADGHYLPRLIDQPVPGLAAYSDDLIERFEDPVGSPLVAHELPDVLYGVQLGRSWWQWQQ